MMRWVTVVATMALAASGSAHADDKNLAEMVFCAKAAVFAETFIEGVQAGKSRDDSVARAVVWLNKTYTEQVDANLLKILMPWAYMVDRLPGYRPSTGGALVALSCMAALKDAKYVQMGSPTVVASVKKLLDSCESAPDQQAVGACIKKNFDTLPFEKL